MKPQLQDFIPGKLALQKMTQSFNNEIVRNSFFLFRTVKNKWLLNDFYI